MAEIKTNMNMSEDDVFTMLDTIMESLDNGANAALPSPEMVSHYVLDANRKLFLEAVVSADIIEITKRIIRWNIEDKGIPAEKRTPIWLYIMNFGGSADYMWQLIDVIDASETPVYTVNIGVCASAAALIFLAGHERYMMKRAHLLIHEGSAGAQGDAQKFLDASDSYKKMLKAMRDYILERTEIPAATLSRKKNNDWELDAAYCAEHGVCDHIVSSLDEIL